MLPFIMAGMQGASMIMNLLQQGKQNAFQQQSLNMAQEAQAEQQLIARLQQQMAMAPRTNARGDTTFYQPGVGWQENLSPTTRTIIGQSDALTQKGNVNQLVRGEYERGRSFDRRLEEGAAADPLLRAVANGYGAPTREGVAGKSAIAAATSASEGADNIRRGYTGAALRTGQGYVPLASSVASLDRGATSGLRSALAASDAGADPLFQAQLKSFQEGKLNPYNMLATRAGNSSDTPFAPENLSSGVDQSLLAASTYGPRSVGGGSEALYRGAIPAITASGGRTTPNYGLAMGSLSEIIRGLMKGGGGGEGGYQTGSKPFDDFLTNRGRDPMYQGGGGF